MSAWRFPWTGFPEHHDIRRKPATYERILKNIEGREVNIHWVITRPMLERAGYLEEYVKFWSERPETNCIWVSVYTPQIGEQSPETLTPADRETLARELPSLAKRYPKLLFNDGLANAFLHPPKNPDDCLFAKMSANYSADFETRVEPCVFGGRTGLLPVRMRRQQRLALDQRDQGGGSREGRSFYRQLGEDRPHDEPPSVARGSAYTMEHSASIYEH